MTPDALEAIFVQREGMLRSVLESIRTGAITGGKKNILLVGPRGIGKTHLLSLIYYRLQAMEDLRGRILTAWLREEELAVACFRDVLLGILRALLPQGTHTPEVDQLLDAVHSLEAKDAESAAVELIKELAGDHRLVILTENFGDLIKKLGNTGEAQLHRFLKDGVCCSLVATSPDSVNNMLSPESPFSGDFFETQQLQELSFDDAIQLISKIAQYRGNSELGECIAAPRGRARVRALRYLAGGNHRAHVVFAPLITQESLDTLIKPLLEIIDDLAPYCNSRIAALSPEQRKILEHVSEARRPVQVTDVARASFRDPGIVTTHLASLCKMGHLQSFQIGDARYYELQEPLMRLSLEVKKRQGKPTGLLLDFLRLWYSPSELKQKIALLAPGTSPDFSLLPEPEAHENWEDPRIAECCREYASAIQKKDYERALHAAEDLGFMRGLKEDSIAQASCFIRMGQYEKAMTVYDRMLQEDARDAAVWQLRGWLFNRMARYDKALNSCNTSLEIDANVCRTWCYKANILLNMGLPNEALKACENAIGIDGKDAVAWLTRGTTLVDLDLFEEALKAFSKAVELDPQNAKARIHLCAALIERNRCDEAMQEAQRAIESNPGDPDAWVMMGLTLSFLDHRDAALYSFNRAISLGEESSFVQYKMVELLFAQNRWREAAVCLDKALGLFGHSEAHDAGNTRELIRCLLPHLSDRKLMRLLVKLLFLIYRKHRMMSALGQGLIQCISEMTSPETRSDEEVSSWLEAWQEIAGDLPEFRLPLRLLDSAVSFRKTHDLCVFMNLPQEERTLLESLIGSNIEAIA